MSTQKVTSKQYFRINNLLYFALLSGQIVFSAITLFLNHGLMFQPDPSLRDIFIYIVPLFVLNGFVTGNIIYKNRLKKIKKFNSLTSKMTEYRGAIIIRMALLEGASLFSIVIYLITADIAFIAMAGIVVLYFLLLKPSREKVILELELNSTERMKVESDEELIAEFEVQG